ncbi:MAG: hypothetical protein ABIK90_07605 [candidate division WOR-3 bacterium]
MQKIILVLIFLIFSLFAESLNVRFIGYYDTPGFANSLFIVNNYAYVADNDSGLRIINISNPQNPYEVSNFKLPLVNFKIPFFLLLIFILPTIILD